MLYVLCQTIERNISEPEVFQELADAQKQMNLYWREALGLSQDEPINEDDLPEDASFDEMEAYCTNRNHDNCDWHIFPMNLCNLSDYKADVLWSGAEDVRSIIDSGNYDAYLEDMDEAAIDELCQSTANAVDWDDVAETSIANGNKLITIALENELKKRGLF